MKQNKTTFETINVALAEPFSQFFTLQDAQNYARVCFTDKYCKDFYKIFKDFAIYYDRVDSYKISIADKTLTDCSVFKASHVCDEKKTKALEFSVKSDELLNTIYEIVAQRLTLANQVVEVVAHVEVTTVTKKRSKKAKAN